MVNVASAVHLLPISPQHPRSKYPLEHMAHHAAKRIVCLAFTPLVSYGMTAFPYWKNGFHMFLGPPKTVQPFYDGRPSLLAMHHQSLVVQVQSILSQLRIQLVVSRFYPSCGRKAYGTHHGSTQGRDGINNISISCVRWAKTYFAAQFFLYFMMYLCPSLM